LNAESGTASRRRMVFSKTLPQLREQWIMRGLRQICHVDQVGLSLATSRTHCDQTHMMGHGPSSQGHFGTDLIAGIYHCIYVARQEILDVLTPLYEAWISLAPKEPMPALQAVSSSNPARAVAAY
jgi:hypothetical protein